MNKIVVNGRERALENTETQARIDKARTGVEQKYQEAWQNCGFWGRFRLRWRIAREVREEMEKIAPTRGLYLASH